MLNVDSDLKRCPESIIEFFFFQLLCVFLLQSFLFPTISAVYATSAGGLAEKQVQRWNSVARLLLEKGCEGKWGRSQGQLRAVRWGSKGDPKYLLA